MNIYHIYYMIWQILYSIKGKEKEFVCTDIFPFNPMYFWHNECKTFKK